MNSEKWQAVKEIFNRALEMSAKERTEYLVEVCAEDEEMRIVLERMLAYADEDENDSFEKNPFEVISGNDSLPEKIGDYRIIREIGRGGMGVVYEALRETADFKQKVALKVIKRGMDTDAILSRFRHEQQILATLVHPNIARFLDGGMTADGLAFYAMEYIEGEFIDDYCRQKSLSLNECLVLFRQVCSAVQYAHQNLVIHRDLKPSNILVTGDGTPKLLDFGIGKILESDFSEAPGTATALGMMTPAYASPEQIRGERVNTATDVYSLGVILFEILTGQRPYKINSANQYEIQKIICESEPLRPSSAVSRAERWSVVGGQWLAIDKESLKSENATSVNDGQRTKDDGQKTNPKSKIQNPKSLRGDLDNILLKSLQKNPAARYASVAEFSEDIRLHLEGLPITARPDTFAYRAAKFIKRNRIPVVAALLVFVSLCAGIGVALRQTYQADKQRLLAEKRFSEVRQIANKVVFKYTDAITNLPNSSAAREMIISDSTIYLDNLAQDAKDDAALQNELGLAYVKLGDIQGKTNTTTTGNTTAALENYRKAISLFESIANLKNAETNSLQAKRELIDVYEKFGSTMSRAYLDPEKRGEILSKRISLIEELLAVNPGEFKLKIELGRAYASVGNRLVGKDFDAALKYYQEKVLPLLAEAERIAPTDKDTLRLGTSVYSKLGLIFINYGKLQEDLEESPDKVRQSFQNSLDYYERALKVYEKRLEVEQNNVSSRRNYVVGIVTVAIALRELKRYDESLIYFEKGRRLYEELAQFDSKNLQAVFDLGDYYSAIGLLFQQQGDNRAAILNFEKSLTFLNQVISTDPAHHEAISYKTDVLTHLANSHSKSGDLNKALTFYKQAEDLALANLTKEPSDRIQYARIFLQRGKTYLRFPTERGAAQKAEVELRKSLETLENIDSDEMTVQREIIKNQIRKLNSNTQSSHRLPNLFLFDQIPPQQISL